MATGKLSSNDYAQLMARFGAVRRGWKRAAALSGLAIVVTESVGIFTALLFIDWLYQPSPSVRLGLWAAALGCIGYFFARHVYRPLARKIPDEQIALYIEEHGTEFDGVLITAVEYERKRNAFDGASGTLIDAVIQKAAARSGRIQVSRVVDFSRWKKYGIAALASIGLYIFLGTLFPTTFGHRLGRILQPWHTTPEDVARHAAAEQMAAPIRFTLSRGDTRLPRGASFVFEVTLSKPKPAGVPVELHFRSRAPGAEWQHLALTEIEKLNGFQGAIPDVSEDLEFYVASGQDKSDLYRLTVFDPLVVQSLEMTLRYPVYLKLPDETEHKFAGDLTAVIGSTATLRILTSTPIKEGQLRWSNGKTQSIAPDPKMNTAAMVSFEVNEDATYDYSLIDVNGQQAASAAPLSVHAIADTPPTLQVKSPQSPVLTQPLGEIEFEAQAGDDFGVAGVDLVYALADEQGESHETRVPLKIAVSDTKSPHVVDASYRLMLEDANPPFKPNDAISYHLEARDAGGRKTSSEIGFILIGYFEHWATWATPEESAVHDETAPDLMALLHLTWDLDSKKPTLPAADFRKQSSDIADKIVGQDGTLVDFLNLEKFPQLARVANAVNAHLKKAHDALTNADTPAALADLTAAMALTAGGKLKADSVMYLTDPQMMVGSHFSPPTLTMLEQARLNALAAESKDKMHDEGDQAEKAAEMARKVEELLKKQDALIAQAERTSASSSQPDAKAKAPDSGQSPNAGGAAQAAAEKPDLAVEEHALADKARAAGAGASTNFKEAAVQANEASRLMEESSRAFSAGKNSDGQAKANQAKISLQNAVETLHHTERDNLEGAMNDAARRATVLREKQQDLTTKTDALAAQLGDKTPDQRQQRDLQALAYQQTTLGAGADALGSEIGRLNQLAAQSGQTEVTRALTEAQRVIKRSSPLAKMSNATVDLNNGSPAQAAEEQKAAQTSLGKIVENLQAGSDALAGNRGAQLSRAERAATDARDSLAAMQAKGGGAPGKGGPPQGATPEKSGQSASSSSDAPGGGGSTSDDARKAAYNLTQLTAVVDNRQLVPQDDVDRLKDMNLDRSALEKRLAVDPKFLQGATDIVGRIRDKIEAEIAAKAAAGKLFSSQREECPPNYRPLVNKYFEALSQAVPAPSDTASPSSGRR